MSLNKSADYLSPQRIFHSFYFSLLTLLAFVPPEHFYGFILQLLFLLILILLSSTIRIRKQLCAPIHSVSIRLRLRSSIIHRCCTWLHYFSLLFTHAFNFVMSSLSGRRGFRRRRRRRREVVQQERIRENNRKMPRV